MTKENWAEFIGIKKRTAATHFSLGRRCSRCDRYINNRSKYGLCKECYRINRITWYRSPSESEEHKELKVLATQWLTDIGCVDVKEEFHAGDATSGHIILDVTGYRNGSLIAVECGGSQERKLKIAMSLTNNIYIWPYNYQQPFLFKKGMRICNCCGNLKSCIDVK